MSNLQDYYLKPRVMSDKVKDIIAQSNQKRMDALAELIVQKMQANAAAYEGEMYV